MELTIVIQFRQKNHLEQIDSFCRYKIFGLDEEVILQNNFSDL